MPQTVTWRQRRVVDGARFDDIFANRCRVYSARFCMYVAPNTVGFARLGFAVSRRVSKKAVIRNRIKRQIRESFRDQCKNAELSMFDYVVIAKLGTAERTKKALRIELDKIWQKARRKGERYMQT